LAIWLAEEPASMLPILNEVAADIVAEVYPDYCKIHSTIFVRIRDLPVEDKLRDLRQLHLNALVKFRGVVTKRSGVYP
jgi:DNA replication licensing factor MCM2